MKKIRHYVFGAALCEENEKFIKIAKKALEIVKNDWEQVAWITGYYNGSESGVNENDGGNYSIYFEDDANNIDKLISSCMSFQREYTKLEMKEKI